MKIKPFYFLLSLVMAVFCFPFFYQSAEAIVSGGGGGGGGSSGGCTNCHVIALKPGWSVFSVPRLVASHQFSVAETNTNFDIFLLDNTKPSGWATMADLGQTEFTPLFGYFINNKTTSTQSLTVNYKKDVEPSQRLFNRVILAGWNVIGIANPENALRQKENSLTDTNNVVPILSSFSDKIDLLLDFTADQSDKSSVKIGDSWGSKTSGNFNSLNDFRETKACAVYVKTAGTYHGYQNNDEVRISDPVSFFDLRSGTKTVNEKTNNVELMDFSVNTGYPINFSLNGVNIELWSDGMKDSDVSNLKLICNGSEKIVLTSPLIGLNYITASSSLPLGISQCKLIVDVGDIDGDNYIQATIRGLDNPNNWKIYGNSIRNAIIPSEIRGYWVEVEGDIQAPAVTASVNALSAAMSVVVGTSNVEVLNLNLKANATDALKVTSIKVKAIAGDTMSSAIISQYRLYKDGDANPIKSVSGSKIGAASQVVDFDNLAINVPKNESVKYKVTADFVQDNSYQGTTTKWGVYGFDAEDVAEHNAVYDATNDSDSDGVVNGAGVAALTSARTVTLVGSGYLSISTDNANANTNKAKYEIAGNTSTGYLAAFKMRSGNENVKIEDLSIYIYNPSTGAGNLDAIRMFSSLSIVDENGAAIPGGTINNITASTTFAGINLEIPQATKTYYLKGVLNPIGKDQIGMPHASATFAIADVVARGVSSNVALTEATTTACVAGKVCYNAGSDRFATANSLVTEVLASRISVIDLVSSAVGYTRATSLSAGWNTVVIVKLTTDNNVNTLNDTGDEVASILSQVKVNYTKNATTTVNNWSIEKCGGLGSSTLYTTATADLVTFANMDNIGSDNRIAKQSTVYYAVKAYVSGMQSGTGNDWIQTDLSTLDGVVGTANIGWQDTTDASSLFRLNLPISKIDGTKIVEP